LAAHLRHHPRFYTSCVAGVACFLLGYRFALPVRIVGAGDAAFILYLVMAMVAVFRTSAMELCERAAAEDEGIFLVILIVVGVMAACFVAIFAILNQEHRHETMSLVLALACAPLGWLTLHTIASFHYANLYYAPLDGSGGSPMEPLEFPGGGKPNAWDFLYYSFVVGMTAQVSDVQVRSTKMRRATMGHGIVSFFFNTVLLAMAVNAAVAIAQ